MRKPNKKERLRIYKKALDIRLKNNTNDFVGLCLLLMDLSGNGFYNFDYASKYFPEFGLYYDSFKCEVKKYKSLYNSNLGATNKKSNKWRIKVLEEIIKEMETK